MFKQEERIKGAKETLDLLKKKGEGPNGIIWLIDDLIMFLEKSNNALQFYADKDNHVWSHTFDETGEVEEIPSKISLDRGRIARNILGMGDDE